MSTGFIGDRPRGGSGDARRAEAGPQRPVEPVAPEAGDAVASALARTRLRHVVDRPVASRAVLATSCLTGMALVIVPAATMTRLPGSLTPEGSLSATGSVLAVVAMACGALVLVLTAVLGGRRARLGAEGHVAAIMQSVAVCTAVPENLSSTQRAQLIALLRNVADHLRRLSDATSADRVEASCAVLEGRDERPDR